MKLFVVFALVAVASAAAQQRAPRQNFVPSVVNLLRFNSDNDGLGNYAFSYEQDNGQKQEEQGTLKNAGTDNEALAVKGSYEWVGPDGVTYNVNYVADENGYQPTIEQGPGGAVPPGVVASLLG
ncbi:endocuticle structural glycoprotein ABD-5-like [Leguminivora glycinivorella]|uniref:endocuticle structural glycoprotein ABD-5-like n=1 Tax=Leguminivora glycinivorella TaxID=1035111 RepID=UPI00200C70E5|nr:endocuticle structural glycoprotein ABD-5-like [Leguminivora glycinivorella]